MKFSFGLLFCMVVCLAGCNKGVEPVTKGEPPIDKSAGAEKKTKLDTQAAGGLANVDVTTLREGFGVGDLAPEIVGEDSQGVSFALSDYRGKVVMLDFWGDW